MSVHGHTGIQGIKAQLFWFLRLLQRAFCFGENGITNTHRKVD
jgi:hypothetical protein